MKTKFNVRLCHISVTPHLPLPKVNMFYLLSLSAKCWVRGGIRGEFPPPPETCNDPTVYTTKEDRQPLNGSVLCPENKTYPSKISFEFYKYNIQRAFNTKCPTWTCNNFNESLTTREGGIVLSFLLCMVVRVERRETRGPFFFNALLDRELI